MADTTKLQKALKGMVGLYPTLMYAGNTPAPVHTRPLHFLSEVSALLDPEVLEDLGPNIATSDIPAWSNTKTYAPYAIVGAGGKYYEATNAPDPNVNKAVTDTDFWEETTLLSAWFSRLERAAINQVASLAVDSPAPVALLNNQFLYTLPGNMNDTINPEGRFVGYQLFITSRTLTLQIVRAGLQTTGPLVNFPLYIFSNRQTEPLYTIRLNGNTSGRMIYADEVNIDLVNDGSTLFYIGYFESDLPNGVRAVASQRTFNTINCGSCSAADSSLVSNRVPHLRIQPIILNSGTDLVPGELNWSNLTAMQIGAQTWGLNMVIRMDCDPMNELIENKGILSNALLWQMGAMALDRLANNTRVNTASEKLTSKAYIALKGSKETGDKGVEGKLQIALDNLKSTLTTLNPICMPAKPRRGIEIGSMFD